MAEPLVVGRTVHYVLEAGRSKGACRPAVVVRVWNLEPGTVNLQVITDQDNDGLPATVWKTSITPGLTALVEPNHWHWPGQCDARLGT